MPGSRDTAAASMPPEEPKPSSVRSETFIVLSRTGDGEEFTPPSEIQVADLT